MDRSTSGFTISWSLLKLMSVESVMPSNHLILCCLLLMPSIFPSIRVFSNQSVLLIWWPKCWSFSFSTSPSNEYSGLISFRMDWFDFLAVQGTLESFLAPQFESINSSALSLIYGPTVTSSLFQSFKWFPVFSSDNKSVMYHLTCTLSHTHVSKAAVKLLDPFTACLLLNTHSQCHDSFSSQ